MAVGGEQSSYFVLVRMPLVIAAGAAAALIFYLAGARIGATTRMNFWTAITVAFLWVVLSLALVLRMPRSGISEDLSILVSSSLVLAAIFGLSMLCFRVRATLALALSLLCASAWYIAVWFLKTGN